MNTEHLTCTETDIAAAADILAGGGLCAVPTETVYGLAGNALNTEAVEQIYNVKGRPEQKPLSLMVSGAEAMAEYCPAVPRGAYILAEKFWPGPLTIVLPADCSKVPDIVRAGGSTAAFRCPDCAPTLALLRRCAFPLAVPSANPSGEPSPKDAETVAGYFDGKIEGIIDGGPCGIGTESTIVDLSGPQLRILREGALPEKEIFDALIQSLCIIGITGGTGSGKTTALDVLRDYGALVIDADAVYHDLCRDDTAMLEAIGNRFPGCVRDGELQRKQLGTIVFKNPRALADLQAITDPCVERAIDLLLASHAAAGGKYAAVDAIHLLEGNLADIIAISIGIIAPEEARIQRLVLRENITREYAFNRVRAQQPASYYERVCTCTVCNDGTPEKFRDKCETLFKMILEEK